MLNKTTNTVIYLILEDNYLDIINHILQVHGLSTIIIDNNNAVKKGLRKVANDSFLITDYRSIAEHYANFNFKKIICLIPKKIKIKHNLKNIIFYELPIIHTELISIIKSELN